VVEKDFVKISEGNINQQSYDTYQKSTLLERQYNYQQDVAAAKQDWTELILRDGSVFSGKYLGIIFGGIKFKTIDNNIVKPTPTVKSIQKLSINGLTIINNGRWVVPKKFVKDYQGNINQQSYDNYQQDYQQGVAAAKKDWADSQRFYGILSPTYESLHLMEKNQILVTDSQAPVPGFRDGYRKEIAKLVFKQRVKRYTTCGLLWFYFIGFEVDLI
jgi:hypothetical protein